MGTKTLVPGGHAFVLDKDGKIDIWQLEMDYHNGPKCAKCHQFFCHHCHREVYSEKCPEDFETLPGMEFD